jgi:hypothetical protein
MGLTNNEYTALREMTHLAQAWGYLPNRTSVVFPTHSNLILLGKAGESCARVTDILMRNLQRFGEAGSASESPRELDERTFTFAQEYVEQFDAMQNQVTFPLQAPGVQRFLSYFLDPRALGVEGINRSHLNRFSTMLKSDSSLELRVLIVAARAFQNISEGKWAESRADMKEICHLYQPNDPRWQPSVNLDYLLSSDSGVSPATLSPELSGQGSSSRAARGNEGTVGRGRARPRRFEFSSPTRSEPNSGTSAAQPDSLSSMDDESSWELSSQWSLASSALGQDHDFYTVRCPAYSSMDLSKDLSEDELADDENCYMSE